MKKVVLVRVPDFDIFNFTSFTNMEETILREWTSDEYYPEDAYEDEAEDYVEEECSDLDDLDWDSPFAPTEEDMHEYYLRSQCS